MLNIQGAFGANGFGLRVPLVTVSPAGFSLARQGCYLLVLPAFGVSKEGGGGVAPLLGFLTGVGGPEGCYPYYFFKGRGTPFF